VASGVERREGPFNSFVQRKAMSTKSDTNVSEYPASTIPTTDNAVAKKNNDGLSMPTRGTTVSQSVSVYGGQQFQSDQNYTESDHKQEKQG
jgi:hypothetical protein